MKLRRITGFDEKLYEKTRKKASRHSTRELMDWADNVLSDVGYNLTAYRHQGRKDFLDELRYELTSLLAVVDEIQLDHEVRNRQF